MFDSCGRSTWSIKYNQRLRNLQFNGPTSGPNINGYSGYGHATASLRFEGLVAGGTQDNGVIYAWLEDDGALRTADWNDGEFTLMLDDDVQTPVNGVRLVQTRRTQSQCPGRNAPGFAVAVRGWHARVDAH